jgi:16S rRNA (cytosine967-C5)-methyltransferase
VARVKIRNFVHKGLKKLYTDDASQGVPPDTVDKLARCSPFRMTSARKQSPAAAGARRCAAKNARAGLSEESPHFLPPLSALAGESFRTIRAMPVSPARATAFDILVRVERASSYAVELLHSAAYHRLSQADHALATELVMGVLRWRSRLDEEISRASSQPLRKLDLEVLAALRLALYQFRWLDRIPARAALHESVELVKRSRKRSAAAFVNAVLRKLCQAPRAAIPSSSVNLSPQLLSETFAHPLWMVDRWASNYGLAAAHQICQHNQSIPTTAIRLRVPEAESQLAAQGMELLPGALLSSARRFRSGDITGTEAFRNGHVVIQEEASQLVAALVAPGANILDCCAAPGGKTLALADRNRNAAITAIEIHPHRARLLRQRLSIEASSRIKIVAADVCHLPIAECFDRILADVPCSGTGTLGRNPEIKWRLKPEDLPDLHARQFAILLSALAQVAPGGQLVYSTCSLEKEENEDVVERAISENKSFGLVDCLSELTGLKESGELLGSDPASLTRGPYLRTIPGVHPCDGFFAAILKKK